jgi:hypothetical protein
MSIVSGLRGIIFVKRNNIPYYKVSGILNTRKHTAHFLIIFRGLILLPRVYVNVVT